MAGRFRENSVLRPRVGQPRAGGGRRASRCIVCGDFTYAMSYDLPHHGQGPERRFQQCGSGLFAYVPRIFQYPRIDYVLSSEGFDALSYEVPTVDYSDHHPSSSGCGKMQ